MRGKGASGSKGGKLCEGKDALDRGGCVGGGGGEEIEVWLG